MGTAIEAAKMREGPAHNDINDISGPTLLALQNQLKGLLAGIRTMKLFERESTRSM